MNLNSFENALAQGVLFMTVLSLLGTAITIWIAYAVIKAAIRQGIKESGLVEALRQSGAHRALEDKTAKMPDMRAD